MPHARSYAGTRDCDHCGTQYRRRADEAKKGRGLFCSVPCSNMGRFGAPTVDIATVRKMYCDQNMTLEETAHAIGIAWKRVRVMLINDGVTIRARKRRRNPNRRSAATYRKLVVAKKGEVVHHLNCVETDDRLANLVAVSRSRHAELHKQLETISARLFDAGLVTFDLEAGYQMADRLKRMAN